MALARWAESAAHAAQQYLYVARMEIKDLRTSKSWPRPVPRGVPEPSGISAMLKFGLQDDLWWTWISRIAPEDPLSISGPFRLE